MQADLLRAGGLGRGRQRAAGGLDEEGAHVTEDEDERDALRFEAEDAVIDEKEMGHAAEDHVDEGVDPQGGEEDEELLRGCGGAVQLLLDADGAEYVPCCLPRTAHYEDPGKGFPVQDGLQGVGEGREAEEADEEDCGAVGGAVIELCVWVRDGVAFEAGHRRGCWAVWQDLDMDLKESWRT